MVTIPPIKIVMAGGWFIIVLPTVFMIYFRTYSFEPADPQANMITLSCHPMEHGVSWLMTALWHPVMYPTVKSPNCRAIVLARDESSFELSNCTIIIFGLVVFCSTCRKPAIKALMLWLQPLDTPASSGQVFTAYGMIWVDDSGKPPGNSGLNIPSCW